MGSATAEPCKQTNKGGGGGGGENVWSSILSEVRSNASMKLPAGRAVVVLGHPESGKTTLVAKLQGIEDPKKGSGLEYTYIEIRDEYREDTTHLSVFTLDGDKSHFSLVKFALNESSLSPHPPSAPPTVILTVSMTTPWLIIEQLQEWAGMLHDHVDNLPLPTEEVTLLREAVVRRWTSYTEPDEEQHPENSNRLGGMELEGVVLGEGVLVRNIGVDIVVVVTKTDHMAILERDESYRDEHFDFIQYHIRKFCLAYGASLLYTSVKEDKNCDLLYKYLVHRVYGGQFKTPALVVEKEAVFVPSGWDNLKKMAILHESFNQSTSPNVIHPDSFYNDVIPRPLVMSKKDKLGGGGGDMVEVEEEQVFLERQMGILSSGGGGGGGGGGGRSGGKTPGSGGGGGEKQQSGRLSVGGTPKKGEQCTDRALATFFNSLLSKKSGSGSGSGPSSANNSNNTSLSGTDC